MVLSSRNLLVCIVAGFLLATNGVLAATTTAPTNAATPTLRPTKAPTDVTVGTANAPTTPGGACLNEEDYLKWTTAITVDGKQKTGFDVFPVDLQICAETCATTLTGGADTAYVCGGFAQPACPSDLNAQCVRDCLARQGPKLPSFPAISVSYSVGCASCMGVLSFCGARNCTGSCIQGGSINDACRTCNEDKCNPAFMICSGLNPSIKTEAALDTTPILIGSVAGGVALLALAAVLGTWHRSRTRKFRNFSPEDMAKLAMNQSMAISPGSQTLSGSFSGNPPSPLSGRMMNGNPQANNPGYVSPQMSPTLSSSSGGSSNLTPYQQQYLAQQDAIAKGLIDPQQQPRVAPSIRASRMVSNTMTSGLPQSLIASARPLVVMFEFIGESNDELTAKVGDKIIGIEQQDGWWLAQDQRGVIGLISAAYCELDTSGSGPAPTSSRVEPAF